MTAWGGNERETEIKASERKIKETAAQWRRGDRCEENLRCQRDEAAAHWVFLHKGRDSWFGPNIYR